MKGLAWLGWDLDRDKEIVARLPEDVLEDIGNIVKETNKTLSVFVTEACCFYVEKVKRDSMLEAMKRGYVEMAEINQVLAEEIWCDFACPSRTECEIDYHLDATGEISYGNDSDKWRKT